MEQFAPILAWIDLQAHRMRSLVHTWAEINSYSYNLSGLETFSVLLRREWERLGEVTEHSLQPERSIDERGHVISRPLGKALRIVKRPSAHRRVFLCIHMDTVYLSESAFQHTSRIDANTLRGPGVCDAKGGLAVMLIAVEALERSPWAEGLGWEVLINPDEEIGSPGSSPLFEAAARANQFGLLFEPTLPDGSLVAERGGSGSYAVVIHGRSAHAGRDPHLGRNAIVAAAELAMRITALAGNGVTINVGKIDGGGPVNVVPDLAICRFNVRVRTPADQQRISEEIGAVVNEFAARDGFRVELHGGFHRPPKPLDDGSRAIQREIEQCGRELNIPITWRYSGGVSDGNQLAAAGLPNIDSLGPRGGNIHSPEEFLLLDSLAERAKLAALFLMKMAQEVRP